MFVLITFLLLVITAIGLILLFFSRPTHSLAWLAATGGTFMAWLSVFFWQMALPATYSLPAWKPESLFAASPALLVDGLSWPYALSLVTLTLVLMLTSVVRKPFPNLLAWAGTLALTAMGLIAVLADNPLTLVLGWAAIDLVELATTLRSVNGVKVSENAVIAFSVRLTGLFIVLWANMVSLSAGTPLNFETPAAGSGLYLLLASGLRLGVLPLHLPYTNEPSLRRGFGTMLRLVSAASSLVLLARVPLSGTDSPVTPWLLGLTAIAALFGGWQWLRASDELTGRPFWIIGMGALAVGAALQGNPTGSVAWGVALIFSSSVLFVYSVRQLRLTRLLLVALLGLSGLPFMPTASGWSTTAGPLGWFWLAFIPAQAMLMAGFIIHMRQPSVTSLSSQPRWEQVIFPTGMLLPVLLHLSLGFWGWKGALTLGVWWAGLAASLLTYGLYLLSRRTSLFSPQQRAAHWIKSRATLNLDRFYGSFWGVYRLLARLGEMVSNALEGDGGIIWVLLILVLFVSLLTQGGN